MLFYKTIDLKLKKSLLFFLLLGPFSSICLAQFGFLPDSIELHDARFFKNKAWRDTVWKYADSEKLEMLHKAFATAKTSNDVSLEAFAGIKLALGYLHKKNYSESFNWLNRTLLLDSLLDPLSPVKQYVYRETSSFYADFGTYETSLKFIKKAIDISLKRDPKPTLRLYRLLSSKAILFSKAGRSDSSLFYYYKAAKVAESMGSYLYQSSAMNNYGMMLQSLGQTDSALKVFYIARNLMKLRTAEDSSFITSINDNMAEIFALKQNYAEALRLFSTKFSYAMMHRMLQPATASGIRTSDMMIKLGRIREARKRLVQVDSIFAARPDFAAHFATSSLWEGLYRAKLNVAEAEGNTGECLRLQQQLITLKDSIIGDLQNARLSQLEGVMLENAERFNKEIEIQRLKVMESSARARFNRILAIGAFIAGILIVAIIMLLYRRRSILNRFALEEESYKRELAESSLQNEKLDKIRLRQQLELNSITIEQESYKRELAEMNFKNEQLEKMQISQQLELKKRDVTDYALAYSQRRKILDEVLSRLKDIKRSGDPEKQLEELTIALKKQLRGDPDHKLDPGRIEKVNHEFFEKLQEICPDLTSGEKELFGLIRLNFSSKEISTLKNISPASVRISKFRLKKKLRLSGSDDLIEFIRKM